MSANCSAVNRGKSVSRIFARTLPVCSAENKSVEKTASTHNHRSVGIHARSFRDGAVGLSIAEDDKCLSLFQSVVWRFTRDDHVVYMAFAQSSAADAYEPRFLLQFRN